MKLIAGILWVMYILFAAIAALGRTGYCIDLLNVIVVAVLTYFYAYELGKVNAKGGGE
jgi:hypothetical protein